MKKPQERELADDSTQPSQPEGDTLDADLVEDLVGDVVEGEEEQEAEEEPIDDLPEKTWPTLEEYKAKWDAGVAKHSRCNPGAFSRDNLAPEPIPQLWQDVAHSACNVFSNRPLSNYTPAPSPMSRTCSSCSKVPYVPFDQLKTDDAIARLGRCRLG